MFKHAATVLSVSGDAKTVKGEKSGYLTGILYLAPHEVSGYQVCPKASEGCKAACLYTAGHGIYKSVQVSRINRTKWFFEERATFMAQLVADISKLVRKAKKYGMTPIVRLNGTSDIAWEKIAVVRDGQTFRNMMLAFPEIQFYDYTAILNRHSALALPNYHLTFSLKENNDSEARQAITQGYSVAVVMNTRRSEPKPEKWSGFTVIDGDKDDIRSRDEAGHIVALSAKGKARYDATGFVRDKASGFSKVISALAI